MKKSKRIIWIILVCAALLSAFYNSQTEALTGIKTDDLLVSNAIPTTDPIKSLQRSINPIEQAKSENEQEQNDDYEENISIMSDTQNDSPSELNRAGVTQDKTTLQPEIPLDTSIEVDIPSDSIISEPITSEVGDAGEEAESLVDTETEIENPSIVVDPEEEDFGEEETPEEPATPEALSLDDRIAYWCTEFVCDAGSLSSIMACSSGGNPDAVSENGELKGLFMFSDETFTFYSSQAGVDAGIIWNSEDQIRTAAYLLSTGKLSFFGCGV